MNLNSATMSLSKPGLRNSVNFDTEEYLDQLFQGFSGLRKKDGFVKHILDFLHHTYKDGAITGDRLLDIGSGPVSHNVFPAAQWFTEIVLSDVWQDNLTVLRHWKEGKRYGEESILKYLIGLAGRHEYWKDADRRLAEKVRAIVQFDIRDEDLLEETEARGFKFDCINAVLCHMGALTSMEEYKATVANYSRLLNPGGHLVVVEPLEETFYNVGHRRFTVLHATADEVHKAYIDCGFDVLSLKQDRIFNHTGDSKALYTMVARKP